ncbi:trigger factor [Betaproteobacteria bacterium SCN2]|jgi:trigger factor|nr:trigger factor [Betaproteobacteria bacterium SCN2]
MSQLEVIGSLERRIDLAVPIAAIDAEVETRLKRLAKSVKAPGFRPGKVPMSHVSKMHGAGVKQEVLGESLQKTFFEAIDAQQLKVAGMPRFEPREGETDAAEIRFSATFEVYPEVRLGDLGAAALKRPVVGVEEANVDETLDILRKQRRGFSKVDRASQKDDLVKFDFRGTLDGEVFPGGEATDFSTVVGEGRMLKDFEDNLTGLSAGESRGFDMTFPADYSAAHLAGKSVHFDVTMKQVQEPKLPELDAEFARSMGIADGDIARLREEVRSNLQREVKRRIQARVKEAAMEVLLANAELELPKSLVGLEIDRLRQQMLNQIQASGGQIKEDMISSDIFKDQAERRVRLGLIIAEIVQKNDLAAKPEQVRALIDEYAQGYEDPQEVVQWYYQDPQRLQEIEALALEDNVVAWVVGQVQATDEPVKFDDLMGRAA